jgi:hypothetical protein
MIFLNIGDGYSSGCCTGSVYHYAHEDPKYAIGALFVEHPDSRPGSFVNQLAEMYKAKTITVARHRTSIDEILDSANDIVELIANYQEEVIAFIGIPDLYSNVIDVSNDMSEYLLLDGYDDTTLSEEEYLNHCKNRTAQDVNIKISQLEDFIKKLSTSVKKIILYRTTAHNFTLGLPENCTMLEHSVVEMLGDRTAYKREYYDKSSYKTLCKEFLKEL